MSQGLEKGEQFRRRIPFSGAAWSEAGALPKRVEHLTLHLQVRGDVAAGRADRRVTKVVANHRDIDARLQKRNGATVSQHVRSHAAKSWWRVAVGGKANVFPQQVRYTVPGERRVSMALEDHVVVVASSPDDATQGQRGLWPERTDSFLLPLTEKAHLRGRSSRKSPARTANASLTRAPVL